jgi:Zn-dependent peptidase ImmA (M78 family)
MRARLGITPETQRAWRDARLAYNAWRAAVEKQGILVFQVSGVDVSAMRGIAITEQPLPVVAINSRDSYTGRSFSLMHEVAHIALRRSGISDYNSFTPTEDEGRPREMQELESFCNRVAAAVLMPDADVLANPRVIANQGHRSGKKRISRLTDRKVLGMRPTTGPSGSFHGLRALCHPIRCSRALLFT